MGMLTLVYAPPGEPARPIETAATLEELQALVGGYIEEVSWQVGDLQLDVFLDEEGLLKWRFSEPDVARQAIQPNRWLGDQPILGPLVVAKSSGHELTTMTPAEAYRVAQALNRCPPLRPDQIRPPAATCLSWEHREPMSRLIYKGQLAPVRLWLLHLEGMKDGLLLRLGGVRMVSGYHALAGNEAVVVEALMRSIAMVVVMPTASLRRILECISVPLQAETSEERAVFAAFATVLERELGERAPEAG